MDQSRILQEESRLARLSAEAHQALIQFMNETSPPYTAEQQVECEMLGRAAASARESYLRLRRAASSCASRELCSLCSSASEPEPLAERVIA